MQAGWAGTPPQRPAPAAEGTPPSVRVTQSFTRAGPAHSTLMAPREAGALPSEHPALQDRTRDAGPTGGPGSHPPGLSHA